MVGRNKKKSFSFIKDKVRKKLQRWKSMNLSKACKEMLIKSVAQFVPNCVMGVDLWEDFERMMNSF